MSILAEGSKKGSEEKFLFNLHNFDDGQKKRKEEKIAEEEAVPPPVLYTEEDYEKESQKAYQRGVEAGKAEAKQAFVESQEHKIEQLLIALTDQIGRLYAEEEQRHKRFETDLILLFQSFIAKARPSLQNAILKEKIETDLVRILQSFEEEASLEVLLHPEAASLLNSSSVPQLEKLKDQIKITEDKTADNPLKGLISWKNGGAILDYDGLLQKIERAVIDILEVNGIKSEDEQDKEQQNESEDSLDPKPSDDEQA